MKKYIFIFILIVGTTFHCFGQNGFPNYYRYIELATKADSLYYANDFKNAAITYIAAAKIPLEKGIEISTTDMYYNAACSYSRVHKTNDAFICLNIIVSENNFSDYDIIIADSDFDFIKKDKRWNTLINQIKANKIKSEHIASQIKKRTTISDNNNEVIFYPYTDYAKQFLENDSLCFLSINYLNYRVFFTGYSYASQHLNEIKKELSITLNKALSILDTTAYNRGINIVIVDSPEELKELTGFYVRGGFACVGHDLVFIVCNENRRWQFVHEGFHLIANQVWGITQSRLLNEGSAVYADNQCHYDNPIYSIASYIVKSNKSFSIQSLIEDFDNKARENEMVAYIQSAAVFKYLYEKYGVAKMKLLWVNGFEKFETVYGLSITDFEKEWSAYLNTISTPENIDLDYLLKNGCG